MKIYRLLLFVFAGFALTIYACDSPTTSDLNQNQTASSNAFSQNDEGSEDEGTEEIVETEITDDDLENSWFVTREAGTTGSVEFTEGPGSPPSGTGSVLFTLENSEDKISLSGKVFDGATPLTAITGLTYSTYSLSSEEETNTVTVQFNVNYDGESVGSLVFKPVVETEKLSKMSEWQTWDLFTNAGWKANGAPDNDTCSADVSCTLSDLTTAFPNAAIVSNPDLDGAGIIHFVAGANSPDFQGAVDGFTLSHNGESISYDFEAPKNDDDSGENDEEGDENDEEGSDDSDDGEEGDDSEDGEDGNDPDENNEGDEEESDEGEEEQDDSDENDNPLNPQNIEECKNDGWVSFGFKNQGQCIRYVNTGQDSRGVESNDDNESDDEEENDGSDEGENDEEGSESDDDEENGSDDGDESDENEDGNDEGEEEQDESDEGNDPLNPQSIDECKKGGWASFGFQNQGQCIRYVNTGQDSRGEESDDDEESDEEEDDEDGDESDEDDDNNSDA